MRQSLTNTFVQPIIEEDKINDSTSNEEFLAVPDTEANILCVKHAPKLIKIYKNKSPKIRIKKRNFSFV